IDVKASVSVQNRRIVAVELDSFLIGQEHRNAGTVFAIVENLFHLVVAGLEAGNLDGAKNGGFARGDVVFVDRWRRIEGCVAVENEFVIVSSAESARGTQTGKRHFVFELAVEAVNVCPGR